MVRVLLPKADPASDDAADALAIAITHAHHRKARRLWADDPAPLRITRPVKPGHPGRAAGAIRDPLPTRGAVGPGSSLRFGRDDLRADVIGKLRGVIDATARTSSSSTCSGVGYLVHCSSRTLQHLPSVGEAATLSIETHVREDMIRLFGFRSDAGAGMVPPPADRAGRRRQGRARDPLDARPAARSRPPSRPATRPRSPARPASARSSRHASSPSSRTRRRPLRPSTRR